jgi:acetylornithine/succinyldiaminopimelate/putrescine aminotransferase
VPLVVPEVNPDALSGWRERGIVASPSATVVGLSVALAPLAEHPAVSEVRSGVGLLAAVQLAPQVLAQEPAAAARVVAGLRARGVLSRALVDGSLQVSPPFVIYRAAHHDVVADPDDRLKHVAADRRPLRNAGVNDETLGC